MLANDFEAAILSVILRFPDHPERIAQRIVYELEPNRFSPNGHRQIYMAMAKTIQAKQVPNIPNVCRALGDELMAVGGEPYLQSLLGFLPVLGVAGTDGWQEWVRVIDTAGRLRHLSQVVTSYTQKLADFETLVAQTTDIDAFLAEFLTEINSGLGSIRSDYRHVSEVVKEDRRRLLLSKSGSTVDLIKTGMPSLEKFFIPRPSTLGVVTGITSMGKTQLALQMALGAAIWLYENKQPGVVAINELETAGWRLNRRMACCLSGLDSRDISTGQLDEQGVRKYSQCLDYIAQLPLYIDDNPHLTSEKLKWEAMALHLTHGPRILGVADYAELFADVNENEEQRVSNVVRNQRTIAWDTGSSEVMISQLNNAVFSTQTKIGGVGRTRYSGAISQAADWLVEIYNPPQMTQNAVDFTLPKGMSKDFAYALVEKNKDYSTGQIQMQWIPECTRFQDMLNPPDMPFNVSKVTQTEDEF